MRQNTHRQHRPRLIPKTVAVARNHPEPVMPRRQKIVLCRPQCARQQPPRINAVQLPTKLHPLRRRQTQSRVTKFNLVFARRNNDFRLPGQIAAQVQTLFLTIHHQGFDHHRRPRHIQPRLIRLHPRGPLHRREPQPPRPVMPCRRLIPARTFQRRQPVRTAIINRSNISTPPRRKVFQVRLGHAKNSLVRPQPQIPPPVIQNLANHIVRQSVFLAKPRKLSIPKPQQPAAKRPRPDRPVHIRQHRPHRRGLRAVRRPVCGHFINRNPEQFATARPAPNRPKVILRQRPDVTPRAAFEWLDGFRRTVLRQK